MVHWNLDDEKLDFDELKAQIKEHTVRRMLTLRHELRQVGLDLTWVEEDSGDDLDYIVTIRGLTP